MVLKTIAMVVGIIGGVYGLIAGLIGVAIFVPLLFVSTSTSIIYKVLPWLLALLLALAPPITGVVGAGIVRSKPLIGSGLMAAAGIVMIFILLTVASVGVLLPMLFFLIPPASLFLVGAILGVIGKFWS